jgi:hypothetical protein
MVTLQRGLVGIAGVLLVVACGGDVEDGEGSTSPSSSGGTSTGGRAGVGGGSSEGGTSSDGGTAAETGGDASTGGGSSTDDVCERGCVETVAAGCANGPSSQEQCVSDCRSFSLGSCGAEYDALMACADGQPVTCSAQGLPIIEACLLQQAALVVCLSG